MRRVLLQTRLKIFLILSLMLSMLFSTACLTEETRRKTTGSELQVSIPETTVIDDETETLLSEPQLSEREEPETLETSFSLKEYDFDPTVIIENESSEDSESSEIAEFVPVETPTPVPTETPIPTPTERPKATATPKPKATATPKPKATTTPKPTQKKTESTKSVPKETASPPVAPKPTEKKNSTEAPNCKYVANTNSKKFHRPNCASVQKMSEKNKWFYDGSRDDLIKEGYSPCKNCKP